MITTADAKAKECEAGKIASKKAIQTWTEEFQKTNGSAPSNTDKSKNRHLFEAYKKVFYICLVFLLHVCNFFFYYYFFFISVLKKLTQL
jgi:hypothetical protein